MKVGDPMTVGRFAPSPSGKMHLGNLFSFLMAWCSARAKGGEIVLRMEDLDPQRTGAEYAALIRRDLLRFGLDWDREVPCQSVRTAAYDEAFARLAAMGLVYPCEMEDEPEENQPDNEPEAEPEEDIDYSSIQILKDETERVKALKDEEPKENIKEDDAIIISFNISEEDYILNISISKDKNCINFIKMLYLCGFSGSAFGKPHQFRTNFTSPHQKTHSAPC